MGIEFIGMENIRNIQEEEKDNDQKMMITMTSEDTTDNSSGHELPIE